MIWFLLILSLLASAPVLGHDARPIYVDIAEINSKNIELYWKAPPNVPREQIPSVQMPGYCKPKSGLGNYLDISGFGRKQSFTCDQMLDGGQVSIAFPSVVPPLSILIQLTYANGQRHSSVLAPGTAIWDIPSRESRATVVFDYIKLGFVHIWSGMDHLLFIGCLLLLARTLRRILWAISGFTIAHSLTLALSTLGLVSFPIQLVEALISLSILMLAVEIVSDEQRSFMKKYPVNGSLIFGLLHGFGFSSGLKEIGLPQTESAFALISFNLGVEIGQLLFIAVLTVFYFFFYKIGKHFFSNLGTWVSAQRALFVLFSGYLVGGFSGYLTIDRVVSFWA